MAITALPTPPSRANPTNFSTLADAFLGALPAFAIEANAVALAMDLNDVSDTSAESITIGTGSKTFAVTAGKSFLPGMSLKIARTSSPSNWMYGDVTTYSGTSLVMNILSTQGSGGPFIDWTITFSTPGALLTATPLATGFTIAGGTTSKTLTVPQTITLPDILAAGALPYGSAANVLSSLPAGLEGKILMAKGAAAPEWSYNIQEITELCSVD